MQTIFENKVKRSNSGGTSSMGFVVCVGRVGRHVERKHNGGIGGRRSRI